MQAKSYMIMDITLRKCSEARHGTVGIEFTYNNAGHEALESHSSSRTSLVI